jgi:phospholipase C
MQPHNPIEHVVIIVKENHSFDNLLWFLPRCKRYKTSAGARPARRRRPTTRSRGMAAAGSSRGETAIQRKGHSSIFLVRKRIYAV